MASGPRITARSQMNLGPADGALLRTANASSRTKETTWTGAQREPGLGARSTVFKGDQAAPRWAWQWPIRDLLKGR